jgi:hypothetical protein
MSLIGLRLGLCTPRASPAEAVAGWLGPRDLRRIVLGALVTDVRFGVYHALSGTSRQRWNIDSTIRDLAYEPEETDEGAEPGARRPEASDGHLSTCAPRLGTKPSDPAGTW